MEDFVAHTSRPKAAFFILVCAVFVAVGLWMGGAFTLSFADAWQTDGYQFVLGWSCVVFFSFAAIMWMNRLVGTGEQLRVGPTGIRSASWSDRTIPWSEITDARSWSYKGHWAAKAQKWLVLHLRNPADFPGHGVAALFSRANRKMTGGDVWISLAGTDRSFEEAWSAIEQFRTPPPSPRT